MNMLNPANRATGGDGVGFSSPSTPSHKGVLNGQVAQLVEKVSSAVQPIFDRISQFLSRVSKEFKALFMSARTEVNVAASKLPFFGRTTSYADEMPDRILDGNCDNFLRKEIFGPYIKQIRSFLMKNSDLEGNIARLQDSDLKTQVSQLYQHLKSKPKDLSIDVDREFFHKFIQLLRSCRDGVIQYPDQSEEAYLNVRGCLDQFVKDYMMSAVFFEEGLEFLHSRGLSRSSSLNGDISQLPAIIDGTYEQLSANSPHGNYPGLYDPFLLGNYPYSNYYLQTNSGKRVSVIRCSNIASDRQGESGKLFPVGEQFKMFLDAYQREGKKHLYVNMMIRNLPGANESARSQAIEDLEDEYLGTYNVICIDRNSDLYFQKGQYAAQDNASEFMGALKGHLFNDHFYYWSKELNRDEWQGEVFAIIDGIHQKYFGSKEVLSLEERKAFIELVYSKIIDALIGKLEPNSTNFSCKTCIDRGVLTQVVMYLYYLLETSEEITDEQLNYMLCMIFLPAMLTGNRPIQKKYFDQLIIAAKAMIENYKTRRDQQYTSDSAVTAVEMNKVRSS